MNSTASFIYFLLLACEEKSIPIIENEEISVIDNDGDGYSSAEDCDDNNNADVSFKMGTSATESLTIQVLNGGSNKTAEEVHFSTATASGTGDHGVGRWRLRNTHCKADHH